MSFSNGNFVLTAIGLLYAEEEPKAPLFRSVYINKRGLRRRDGGLDRFICVQELLEEFLHEFLEPVFFRFAHGADLRWFISGAQVSAHLAAPHG